MNWRSAEASFRESATLILAGVALVCAVRAQDPEPSSRKDRPRLEVDLQKLGYDTARSTWRSPKFVDFTDASHLAVAWVTLDDPTLADKAGPLTARPAHLHAIVLDATTGQKLGGQAWSTPSTPVRFLGGRDGKLLTCTGNVLRLFSPNFEVLREQNLPNDRGCLGQRPGWGISPSRRSLLLSFFLGRGQGNQNTLLDAETFSFIARWTENPLIENMSDHWLLASCGPKREACIRGIDKPWQPFLPAGIDKDMNNAWLYSTRFVNDDTLVVGQRNKMLVVAADGTQLFHVELGKKRSVEGAVTSVGGERFAVIEDKERGLTSQPLDISAFPSNDRAVVYSIPDHRAIYSVKVKGTSPWPPWEAHTNQLALSPDGTLLAVITDGILRIYRLPESPLAPRPE